MTFNEVVTECAMNDKFVQQFNRLMKCNLDFRPKTSTGINALVDKATGYDDLAKLRHQNKEQEIYMFFDFVFEIVWLPLIQGDGL